MSSSFDIATRERVLPSTKVARTIQFSQGELCECIFFTVATLLSFETSDSVAASLLTNDMFVTFPRLIFTKKWLTMFAQRGSWRTTLLTCSKFSDFHNSSPYWRIHSCLSMFLKKILLAKAGRVSFRKCTWWWFFLAALYQSVCFELFWSRAHRSTMILGRDL